VIRAKGEEFAKQLKLSEMSMHMISGGAIHELMGAMPMSISTVTRASGQPKGAPTEWVPMIWCRPNAGGVALPVSTTNVHAALLMADFLPVLRGKRSSKKIPLRRPEITVSNAVS
jgi:hypothetical protein